MFLKSIIEDEPIKNEILDKLTSGNLPIPFTSSVDNTWLRNYIEDYDKYEDFPANECEAIVQLFGRPVLYVRNNTFEIPKSEVWKERLKNAKNFIDNAIPAVGRIEVKNHPRHDWLGTGWLVDNDIIVTNRHVASEFAKKSGSKFIFRHNFLRKKISARIDFREEYMQPEELEYEISDILHIANETDPDMAFLRISYKNNNANRMAKPIPLEKNQISTQHTQHVVVIGYPAWDGLRNPTFRMAEIYEGVYEVKRMAPGILQSIVNNKYITHDCTTLGGNSGSVVLSIDTGRAVGLHFSGKYKVANYAVPANIISDQLARLRTSRP